MNNIVPFYAAELVIAGFVLFLPPYMTPRRIYFAITVPPDFPESPQGRAIMRFYRIGVTVAVLAAAAALAGLANAPTGWPTLAIAVPFFGGFSMFLVARAKAKSFAAPPSTIAEASLDAAGDRLPGWFWLSAIPFAIPAAVAAYLRAHWSEIPARFPVHWDIAGTPDRWVDATPRGVYGSVWATVLLLCLLMMMAVAVYFGSRRSEMRYVILKINLAAEFLIALTFGGISLLPLVRIPLWAALAPALIFTIAIIVWAVRFASKKGRPAEATPDACWHLGQFYYNPDDPALFVQKRIGLGYTFNFANHLSWMIAAGLLVMILALVVIEP